MPFDQPAVCGRRELDARRYEDRLAMLRALSGALPDATAEADSPWSGAPEAGLEFQTEWQRASGRNFPDDCGRATGWWAAVNYTLTVWPFLAVRRRSDGAFSGVELQLPRSSAFELDPTASERWVEYFELRSRLEELRRADALSAEDLGGHARRLQAALWDAHLYSVRVARSRFSGLLPELPKAERDFARLWGSTTVEYLAALNAPTGPVVSGYFNRLLPEAVLRGDDVLGPQNRYTDSERVMMRTLWELHRYETRHDYRLLASIREAVPPLREAGFFEYGYRALRRAIDDHRHVDLRAVLAAFFRYLGEGA